MNDTILVASVIALLVGGFLGILVGGAAMWFWGLRPKSRALETAKERSVAVKLELLKLRKTHEADAEKLEWLTQAEEKLREAFEALASRSLQTNADGFIERSKSELQHTVEPLSKNLEALEQHLRELEQKREGAYQGLQEHLRGLGEAQKSLQDTTMTLSQALKSTTVRGRWGELQLRRVVEMAGMKEHVDFEEQVTAGDGRPDMIIRLPNGGILPVDSKSPMNAYLEALELRDEQLRLSKLDHHVKAMKDRVRELTRKQYWEQFDESPPFVVMFVPNEASVVVAFERDAQLLEYALRSRVLIATPVTLLALLLSVGYGWQQSSMMENAQEIAQEGKELYGRVCKFAEHFKSLGDSLGRSVSTYNDAVGSLERRLLPSLRRFQELQVDTSAVPEPVSIEYNTRALTAADYDEFADREE